MTATVAVESPLPAPRAVAPLAVNAGAQVQHMLQGRERRIVELSRPPTGELRRYGSSPSSA